MMMSHTYWPWPHVTSHHHCALITTTTSIIIDNEAQWWWRSYPGGQCHSSMTTMNDDNATAMDRVLFHTLLEWSEAGLVGTNNDATPVTTNATMRWLPMQPQCNINHDNATTNNTTMTTNDPNHHHHPQNNDNDDVLYYCSPYFSTIVFHLGRNRGINFEYRQTIKTGSILEVKFADNKWNLSCIHGLINELPDDWWSPTARPTPLSNSP